MFRTRWLFIVLSTCFVSEGLADTAEDAAKIVAVSHMKKGDSLRAKGRLADAEREYDLALASYSDSTNLHSSRGQVRYQLKNYGGAIEDFDFYLSRVPNDTTVLLLRSLSKSSLTPEDVSGSCADLLQIKRLGVSLEKAGIKGTEKYCHGQPGWEDK
jgi:tetratricopeptide (TPR) repeat protein